MNRYIKLTVLSVIVQLIFINCSIEKESNGSTTVMDESMGISISNQGNANIPVDSIFHVSRNRDELREHRVYYVDVSGSMRYPVNNIKRNNNTEIQLMDSVKIALRECMLSCDEPGTIVDIIEYTDHDRFTKKDGQKPLCQINDMSIGNNNITDNSQLISFIKSIDTRSGNTNHDVVIRDFYTNRIKPGYINIMYLITDGEFDDPPYESESAYPSFDTLKNKSINNCYGFYVALNREAKKSPLYSKFNISGDRFRSIDSVSLDINIFDFSLRDTVTVDSIRQYPYIRIPYIGIAPDSLSILTNESPFSIKVRRINRDVNDKYVLLELRNDNSKELKDSGSFNVEFKTHWNALDKRINHPNKVFLCLEYKDVKNREINIANISKLNNAKINFYKKLWFWKAKTDTVWVNLNSKLSHDAIIGNNSVTLTFETPSGIRVIDSINRECNALTISKNNPITIGFTVDSEKDIEKTNKCVVTFNVKSNLESLVVDNEVLYPNETNQKQISKSFNIQTDEDPNPLWWILLVIALAYPIYRGIKYYLDYSFCRNQPRFPNYDYLLVELRGGPYVGLQNIEFKYKDASRRWFDKRVVDSGGSLIRTRNLSQSYVEKVVLISQEQTYPFSKTPEGRQGWTIYIPTDFRGHRCINNPNNPIIRVEIYPLGNDKCKVLLYDSMNPNDKPVDSSELDFRNFPPDFWIFGENNLSIRTYQPAPN